MSQRERGTFEGTLLFFFVKYSDRAMKMEASAGENWSRMYRYVNLM